MNARGEGALRQSMVDACRRMNLLGINQGTSGNISVRWQEGLFITPSGLPYERMRPDDIVPMQLDGSCEHRLKPSSEWRFHCDIMKARTDVGAIVHAHPIFATAFAICRKDIPAVHYMIAAAGGPTIRCGSYASYGTAELSEAALVALEGRNACLLANHGMIATGADLDKAMWLALEVETLCKQYAAALQVGTPHVLSDHEIARNVEKFKTYTDRSKTSGRRKTHPALCGFRAEPASTRLWCRACDQRMRMRIAQSVCLVCRLARHPRRRND